ncbi:hypothetical protein HY988_03260 [Candidatus Micrarchaeota archaeon]|nr:hypothetical protein [Candidatus Micrarchaeota archaeon]
METDDFDLEGAGPGVGAGFGVGVGAGVTVWFGWAGTVLFGCGVGFGVGVGVGVGAGGGGAKAGIYCWVKLISGSPLTLTVCFSSNPVFLSNVCLIDTDPRICSKVTASQLLPAKFCWPLSVTEYSPIAWPIKAPSSKAGSNQKGPGFFDAFTVGLIEDFKLPEFENVFCSNVTWVALLDITVNERRSLPFE